MLLLTDSRRSSAGGRVTDGTAIPAPHLQKFCRDATPSLFIVSTSWQQKAMADKVGAAEACPVDHKTRTAWLEQSKKQQLEAQQQPPVPPAPAPSSTAAPIAQSCDSGKMDQSPGTMSPPTSRFWGPSLRLATDREVSSIPRTSSSPGEQPVSTRPANNEQETGASSGRWIYPSERMFFEAMRRKNFDPQVEDMRAIVPLHNAVNEKAWQEILAWEKGHGSDSYVYSLCFWKRDDTSRRTFHV
jgi:cytochrome c heme-lyase